MVAVVKATCPSPPRPSITELDDDGMLMNQLPQQVTPVTFVYANRGIFILHSGVRWWSVRRPTQARRSKRSQSAGSYPMMNGAVLKRQQMLYEMMDATEPVVSDEKVEKEDQIMEVADVAELARSPEIFPQVTEAMMKVRKAM